MVKPKFKIGRVVKKKIDEKQFLTLRLTGKVPIAVIKKIKADDLIFSKFHDGKVTSKVIKKEDN